MTSRGKQTCVCQCGHRHNVALREIALYKGMVEALYAVMQWCEQKGKHEFRKREISHLISKTEDKRFSDWPMFGGLVYREKKEYPGAKTGVQVYGLNMDRCRAFFGNTYKISKMVYKNPVTGEVTQGEDVTIREIPNLAGFLDENQEYIATYIEPKQNSLLFR